jgi:hypothetical protein
MLSKPVNRFRKPSEEDQVFTRYSQDQAAHVGMRMFCLLLLYSDLVWRPMQKWHWHLYCCDYMGGSIQKTAVMS